MSTRAVACLCSLWFLSSVLAACGEAPSFTCTDLFVGGRDGYHTYRIPAMVVTGQGTVLAFCEGRRTSVRDQGDIDLLLKRSEDGGQTWSRQKIVHEEGGDAEITIGNPCPIVDRDGTIHLLFSRDNKRLFHTHSTDDGRTWKPPTEHTAILNELDYPFVRLGTGPVHGIQLRSGRLVAPIWLCDRELQDRAKELTPGRYRSGAIISDDAGRTWKAAGLVRPELDRLNECAVLERLDGSLLMNMRAHQGGYRGICESSDGGLTWSSPVLDRNLPCPACQASLLRLPPREVLFVNPASDERLNLTVRLSNDDGKSWAHARTIYPGPSGYSDLAVTRDGVILCLYEGGEKAYYEKIAVARFNRAWLLQSPEP